MASNVTRDHHLLTRNLKTNGKYLSGDGGDEGISISDAGIVTASTVVCESTTQAFYPPVVTTTQRDAMTVTQGAMVFNSTDKKMQFYDGTQWMSLPGVTLGLGIGVF